MILPPSNRSFPHFCTRMIRGNLPGIRAHREMDPSPERRPEPGALRQTPYRHSAVLVLVSLQDPMALLYTLRKETLQYHGGQISFPGGRQESDETTSETACREAEEEIGIHPFQYDIAGYLSPLFVPPSGFLIHPWLAFCDTRPEVTRQSSEVSEVFWIEMKQLLDRTNIKRQKRTVRNHTIEYPFWDVHRVPLWGATAMITSEVITLYRRYLQKFTGNKTADGG